MNKQLFVTDFDGTLVNDEKIIHPDDLRTLAALQQQKILTAVATGRSLYSFNRALAWMGLDRQGLPIDYLVFSTGAGVMDLSRDRILVSHAIGPGQIRNICTYFDSREFDYMVHKAIPDTPYFLYKSHGRNNRDFHERIRLYPSFGTPLSDAASLYEAATQVLAILPGPVDTGQVEKIRSALKGFSVIHATSPLDHASAWIEVFHHKVSKARTVSWLARNIGVARENVVSVGNDYNDQDLLEWSGAGFLVENGPRDLKAGFGVVRSNNCCGVSQAARMAGFLS